ncbi:carboxypeptidase-like regulatory domain-containing protein [uncultured Arcticibacterium sp.]|uniref:carboxypeptidase-like regulatory domain-containing protein n=1 Tax=uncultured Arcticibacterium sp. TaxID=2173042 RepID=UPI0030F660F1
MKVKLYSKGLLLVLMGLSLSFSEVFAQNQTVSGKVTGADDGLEIPGVSVVVKGTTNGVSTDIEGNYSLSVNNANTVLVFSFVGYESQEVKSRKPICYQCILSF